MCSSDLRSRIDILVIQHIIDILNDFFVTFVEVLTNQVKMESHHLSNRMLRQVIICMGFFWELAKLCGKMVAKRSRLQFGISRHFRIGVTTAEIATSLNAENDIEHILKVCEHLSANPSHRIEKVISDEPFGFKYSKI